MAHKRVLTIQDISCVGQCSTTVALPILSVCGHETCILPTALLSTHTGGFGPPAVIHFEDRLEEIWRHWQRNNIVFDAILVGYLGSIQAVDTAKQVLEALLVPGGLVIVDPVMGDNGKLYSGFDQCYVQAMADLCCRADILLPNITEAAFLTGIPYREAFETDYVQALLEKLHCPVAAITGVGYHPDQIGIAVREGSRQWHYSHPRVGKGCHGTGDLFAAALTGGLLRGKTLAQGIEIAGTFAYRCVQQTVADPDHWYGVRFEAILPELAAMLA